jgi:hypothetical protein
LSIQPLTQSTHFFTKGGTILRKVIMPVIALVVTAAFFPLHRAAASQRVVLGEFFTNTG